MGDAAENILKPYDPIPTIRAFHESMEPIRCIVGPVGSAKTSGAAMEVCYYAPFFLFKEYGIRKTSWVVVRNCFSSDTKILTDNGWKFFPDLTKNDMVAQLTDNDVLEFVSPSYYYASYYNGEMIGFENEGVDFLVTPDHNLNVSSRNARKKEWGEYRFRKAKDCFGKQNMRVKKDAKWIGKKTSCSTPLFEWLGFWFAEGYAGNYDYKEKRCGGLRCVITQKDNLDYVRQLFENAKIPYFESRRGDGSTNFVVKINGATRPHIIILSKYGKAIDKWIPKWIKDSQPHKLKAFLKGYEAGDGSHNSSGVRTLLTSSKQLADDLQEISLKCGYAANIHLLSEAGAAYCINGVSGSTNSNCYSVTITRKTTPMLVSQGYAKKYRDWYHQQYRGMVYCIEVPSHRVYVRRNGKAHWSSQTYRELMDTTVKTIKDSEEGWFPDGEYKSSDNEYIIRYENGIEVELLFRACDRPDQVKKFKSLFVYGYWIDESIEVADDIKRMLKNRIGRQPRFAVWAEALRTKLPHLHGCTDKEIREEIDHHHDKYITRMGIETTNPPDVEHTTYSEFNWTTPPPGPIPAGNPKPGHAGFWQPPRENELNLRPGYYDDLLNDYADNPDWGEMYVLGRPGVLVRGKLVYNNFRREHHVAQESLVWTGGPLYRGWDNSGNCPACVVAQVPTAGQVQILREFTTDKMGIVDFTKYIVAQCNIDFPNAQYKDWGDPAGANKFSKRDGGFTSNAQLMAEASNVNVVSSDQNFTARVQAVDQALARIDGLLIDPGCTRLINGFLGGYCYPEIQTLPGTHAETPEKNRFSHPHDALQYLLLKLLKSTSNTSTDFVPNRRGASAINRSRSSVHFTPTRRRAA